MKKYKLAIIGGGPAGMIAAISAAKEIKNPKEIILIEKNENLGKKLILTGGGRCNITNLKPIKNFLEKLRKEDKIFLKHSLYTLDSENLLSLFKEKGLEFKEEENNRCFPITDDATSVLEALIEYLNELKVDILLSTPVHSITKDNGEHFIINTENETIYSSKIILTTGGISYPQTGSNGDGHNIAKKFKHTTSNINPGCIPLKVENKSLNQLSGITLEDVEISYKSKITTRGNVLITHFGLSGPAILDISNSISKDKYIIKSYESIEKEVSLEDTFIYIDLATNTIEEELNKRMISDSQSHGKTMIKNYLKYYLKNRFIDFFLNVVNVSGNKTLSNMTKKDKNKIIKNLKQFKIKINSLNGKLAMITCGGININEINPKTMESRLDSGKGIYFAGEILESYGPTGGYNLQIAFSTGYLAGKSAANSLNQ